MLNDRDLGRIVSGCGNFGGIGSAPHLRRAGDSEEQALLLLDHARRLGLGQFQGHNTELVSRALSGMSAAPYAAALRFVLPSAMGRSPPFGSGWKDAIAAARPAPDGLVIG